ncbi:MAG TPA: nuclear transport factor 2 family protein [Vicinamibacterales bacterium]|nr:nuclear transport factor 2 family protein [Vicinamibacterales bacterium]
MKAKVSAAVVIAMLMIGAGVASHARAQQKVTGGTLTAADYIEIQQLVARYGYAVDTHADNGYAYADLFTPDGVFGKTKGREALAELARATQKERAGPSFTRHYLTNVIIYPTPEGARGSQYLMALDVSEGGKPSSIVHGGRYEDEYVKTPAGWRFKSRQLHPAKIGVPPPTAKLPPSSR